MRTLKITFLVFIISITISAQCYRQISNSIQPIHDIEFIDSIHGMAVGGNGTVFKADDGGKIWAVKNIGYTDWLYSIELVNDSICYLTGTGELVYKTTNFGESWIRLYTNAGGNFFSTILFINANVGWIAGDYGIILKTTDGGINWIQQPINTQNFIENIEFIDELHGWAISKWEVFRTINGGN